jgi:hypothetical protein
MFDFLAEIRQRLVHGFYKRSEIAFDGEYYVIDLAMEDKGLV